MIPHIVRVQNWSVAMTGCPLRGGLALILLIPLVFAGPVRAQEKPAPRSVSVSGEGRTFAEPDQATVRFGIVTVAADPETARVENARASADAMNAVRTLGIAERKLRLEQLMLNPAREYDAETRRYKEVGYEVSRRLVVEVDELDDLPTLIAQVVQKGANRLDGVTYDLKDRQSIEQQALVEAVGNARVKAELMADALDARLGEVMQISEQGVSYPGPLRMEMAADAVMMKADAAPEPEAYAAGELEIVARVSATFRLEAAEN